MKHKKNNKVGGTSVIRASVDLVKSMTGLGDSIFKEIKAITNIGSDLTSIPSGTK